MAHHVPRFLSMRRGAGETKIALLVFDGLAVDQWIQIRECLAKKSQKLDFDESACFAWLPTLTSVSRQALFSGLKPREFNDTIETTAQEPTLAIATYPFFGKVAELVGRLSALQGDCASAEVHRRMSEIYGEREGTYRMTNMVLQSQASWGAIERVEKGKRLIRRAPTTLTNDRAVVWLLEAALRYTGKPMSVPTLQSMAVIYPFVLDQPLAYVVSNSPTLELRSEGSNNQFVALRAII